MNYKLCKQLKDAGFKFKPDPFRRVAFKDGVGFAEEPIPILSELIDACGDRFGYLEGYKNTDKNLKPVGKIVSWGAAEYKWEDDPLKKINEDGKTPEEAVAKLWLKLNK